MSTPVYKISTKVPGKSVTIDNRMESFVNWLSKEMEIRGWNQSDLARASGLSRTAISKLITESRNPGIEGCNAIAQAFKLPPETVFRIAGHLPPKIEPEEHTQEIIYRYQNAPKQIREDILEYIRYRTRDQ